MSIEAREKIELMGVELDTMTEPGLAAAVGEEAAAGRGGWVVPINLDVFRQLSQDAAIRRLCEPADYVVADGMPLVWASRLQGSPLPDRVAGSTLIWLISEQAARHGLPIYLLGGNPGAADAAARVLTERYPGLRVSGVACPPMGFEANPEELDRIATELRAADPAIVFVGLGFPKQERLIERLRPLLPGAWFMGVGISFSFVSGEVSRAPRPLQRLGLEWVHRLAQEPRRLFKRYVVLDLPFAGRLIAHALRARRRR